MFSQRFVPGFVAFIVAFTVSAAERPAPATVKPVRPADPVVHGEFAASFYDLTPDYFGPGRRPQRIGLEDAIQQALANNLDVKFDRVAVNIEEARKDFAFGVFDPVFTFSATRESIRRPDNTANLTTAEGIQQQSQIRAIEENTRAIQIATGQEPTPFSATVVGGRVVVFNQETDRFESSIQQRTPWGMRLALTASQTKLRSTFVGDTRTIIPQYSSFAGLQVRQPLLQGFGFDANLADVRIARVNKRVAELEWRKRVADTIQQVMSVYYEMSYALEAMRENENSIAADRRLLEQNQRRMELGFMSPIDVQQARVAVSTDEEALLNSKFFFMERQYQLKRLLSKEVDPQDTIVLIPTATAKLAVPVLDRARSMQMAFENRYEYRAAVAEAEVQDIRLRFARNQMLPSIDLIGSVGFNGLDDSYSNSRSRTFDGQAPQWAVGVQVSVPIGNIQGRSQLRLVRGLQEQAQLRIRQIELAVSVDVDTVISRIETNRQRVETARQSRQLAEEAVRIADRRAEEGQGSSFEGIETRRKLYEARGRELSASAELQKSITQLWLATGTVLERTGVVIAEENPDKKPAPAPAEKRKR